MAQRKLRSKDKKLKRSSALTELVNSVDFKTVEDFQKERDKYVFNELRRELDKISILYRKRAIRKKIEELVRKYLRELREPHRNRTESAFKPVFSRVKIESLDRAGFEAYFLENAFLKRSVKSSLRPEPGLCKTILKEPVLSLRPPAKKALLSCRQDKQSKEKLSSSRISELLF